MDQRRERQTTLEALRKVGGWKGSDGDVVCQAINRALLLEGVVEEEEEAVALAYVGHVQALVRICDRHDVLWTGVASCIASAVRECSPEREATARALLDIVPAVLSDADAITKFGAALFPPPPALLTAAVGCMADLVLLQPSRPVPIGRAVCQSVAEAVKNNMHSVDDAAVKHLLVLHEGSGDSFFARAARVLWSQPQRFRQLYALLSFVLAANVSMQVALLDFFREKVPQLSAYDGAVLLLLQRQRIRARALLPLHDNGWVTELVRCVGPEHADSLLEVFLSASEQCPHGLAELYLQHPHARNAVASALLSSLSREASAHVPKVFARLALEAPDSFGALTHLFSGSITRLSTLRPSLASGFLNSIMGAAVCPAFRSCLVTSMQALQGQRGALGRGLAAAGFAALCTSQHIQLLPDSHPDRRLVEAGAIASLRAPTPVARVMLRKLWTLACEGVSPVAFSALWPHLLARGDGGEKHLLALISLLGARHAAWADGARKHAAELFGRTCAFQGPPGGDAPPGWVAAALECVLEDSSGVAQLLGIDAAHAPLASRRLFGAYLQTQGEGLSQRALWALANSCAQAQREGRGLPQPIVACIGPLDPRPGAMELAVNLLLAHRGRLYDEWVHDGPDERVRWEDARVALLKLMERCCVSNGWHWVRIDHEDSCGDSLTWDAIIVVGKAEFQWVRGPRCLLQLLCQFVREELTAGIPRTLLAAYLSIVYRLTGLGGGRSDAGSERSMPAAEELFTALATVSLGTSHSIGRALLSMALALLPLAARLERALLLVPRALVNNDLGLRGRLPLSPLPADYVPQPAILHMLPTVEASVAALLEECCTVLGQCLRPRVGVADMSTEQISHASQVIATVVLRAHSIPASVRRRAMTALDIALARWLRSAPCDEPLIRCCEAVADCIRENSDAFADMAQSASLLSRLQAVSEVGARHGLVPIIEQRSPSLFGESDAKRARLGPFRSDDPILDAWLEEEGERDEAYDDLAGFFKREGV